MNPAGGYLPDKPASLSWQESHFQLGLDFFKLIYRLSIHEFPFLRTGGKTDLRSIVSKPYIDLKDQCFRLLGGEFNSVSSTYFLFPLTSTKSN